MLAPGTQLVAKFEEEKRNRQHRDGNETKYAVCPAAGEVGDHFSPHISSGILRFSFSTDTHFELWPGAVQLQTADEDLRRQSAPRGFPEPDMHQKGRRRRISTR